MGWNVRGLVVSIIPALVSMRVFKERGRWPGAGGVYGGILFPGLRLDDVTRVCARREEVSYRRAAVGGIRLAFMARVFLLFVVACFVLVLGVARAACPCLRVWTFRCWRVASR